MKLANRFTQRCQHRHRINTHPKCFDSKGLPRYLSGELPEMPKILVFDIETSPLKAYIWQHSVYGGNVSEKQVLSEWFMLTWSAKWLFDDEIMSEGLTGKEALAEDDSRIVKKFWELLNTADVVIAHNGDRFDVPNLNTRFIVNNLPPTIPYQSIDTVKVARRQFGFTHNNLNALARVFGFDVKLDTDFDLWKRCVDGDDEALRYMEEYNRGDVRLLESVYLKLRPWIRPHINIGVYLDEGSEVCPNCGHTEVTWLPDKFYYTNTNKYPMFRCDDCGAFGRSRYGGMDKEKRKTLGVGIGR